MTEDERRETRYAILRCDEPKPQAKNPLSIDEARHSEREGEYEHYMVLAALKAAAREDSKEGVK